MKGLLLKDYYMILKTCRAWLFIVIFFGAFSVLSSDNIFMMVYPCIMSGLIPVTMLSYEERSGWNVYCETMPYTRKQIVVEKYILALLIVSVVAGLMAILQLVPFVMNASGSMMNILNLGILLWLTGIVCPGLTLPFIFRLGVEKGRIAYYVVIALLGGGAATVGFGASDFGIDINAWDLGSHPMMALGMMVIGIIIFLLSMNLAVKFYEKREL